MRIAVLSALFFCTMGCDAADPVASCEEYVDRVEACYAVSNSESRLEDSFCDEYTGLTGSEARSWADFFDCANSQMRSADCSTVEDANQAYTSANNCTAS